MGRERIMGDMPLPKELQHLHNLIDNAESEVSINVLRKVIKSAADKAPATDILRIAKTILQCGVDIERGNWVRRN
jgi:hypothetical protein